MANSGPNGEWLATTPEFWAQFDEPIAAFVLWYADGSCVRGVGDDMPRAWASAPREGVQVLITHHLTHRNICAGRDEYTLPDCQSKLGLEITDALYEGIYMTAVQDRWLP